MKDLSQPEPDGPHQSSKSPAGPDFEGGTTSGNVREGLVVVVIAVFVVVVLVVVVVVMVAMQQA